jgi:hypothetical protein
MADSNELIRLNQILSDIKILIGSLSILDEAVAKKNQVLYKTALDAINFRVQEISQASKALSLNRMVFPIENILQEIGKTNPDAKVLHSLIDTQLETLRKMALSEILTLSIE